MGEENEAAEGGSLTPLWDRRGSATSGSGNVITHARSARQKPNMEDVDPKQ